MYFAGCNVRHAVYRLQQNGTQKYDFNKKDQPNDEHPLKHLKLYQ